MSQISPGERSMSRVNGPSSQKICCHLKCWQFENGVFGAFTLRTPAYAPGKFVLMKLFDMAARLQKIAGDIQVKYRD